MLCGHQPLSRLRRGQPQPTECNLPLWEAGIGARLLDTDEVEFDIGFAGSLPAHADDVEARRADELAR